MTGNALSHAPAVITDRAGGILTALEAWRASPACHHGNLFAIILVRNILRFTFYIEPFPGQLRACYRRLLANTIGTEPGLALLWGRILRQALGGSKIRIANAAIIYSRGDA